jgi:hypothetical protein
MRGNQKWHWYALSWARRQPRLAAALERREAEPSALDTPLDTTRDEGSTLQ